MTAPFLAMIIPISQIPGIPGGPSGPVDPGYSPPWAQVPGGGGGGVRPPRPVDPGYSPPWAQVPPGMEGGNRPVDPGYSPPWAQVPPGTRPPQPQPPLVIWGPGDPRPTPPIANPGHPPGWGMANDPNYGIEVGGGGGQPPLGTWGPGDPRPSNPIAEPPWGWGGTPPEITIPPETPLGQVEWKTAWTPQTGWIVVGIPQGPHATPSTAA